MQVVPVLFEDLDDPIQFSTQWDLSDSDDIYYRFDTYIHGCKRLGSWSTNGTLDENFLAIF